MSVEVRESAELLTSVPIAGRMKNTHPDAASIASCLQLPTSSYLLKKKKKSERWGMPGPHIQSAHVLSTGIEE